MSRAQINSVLRSASRQSFTATAGQTTFTITGGYIAGSIDVYVNGVKMVLGSDYTATNGTSITLVNASAENDTVDVVSGVTAMGGVGQVTRQSFIATDAQTVFTVAGGYQPNAIDVYKNGVKLQNGTDVTVTSGSTFTIATPCIVNDIVDVSANQVTGLTGVTNLSSTQDSTTVSVLSDTGADAILPAATTSLAGVMSAADKVTLRNYGMKNRIINGGMQVAQRGNVTAVNATYTYGGCDRMCSSANSLTSGTILQITGGVASGVCGYNHAINCTTSAANGVFHQTRIESKDTIDLNSRTITISCKVYQDTGVTLTTTLFAGKPTTTADTFSAQTSFGTSTSISLVSSVLTPITLTLTLGSTDASLGLFAAIIFNTTAAVTSKYFTVTDWQLEVGSQATEFEHRPIGAELALCQRYYQFLGGGTGQATGTSNLSMIFPFVVPIRSTPILSNFTLINGTTAVVRLSGSGENVASLGAIYVGTTQYAGLNISPSTTFTTSAIYTSFSPGAISVSAEL